MTNGTPVAETGAVATPSNVVVQTAISGVVGLVIWELFARLIAPMWIGFPLDPTGLIELAFGIDGVAAMLLHLATGLVAYPLVYVIVVRPLAAQVVPNLAWSVLGAAYGVATWVFAMYVVASVIGGAPPFLEFEAITWASLVGHVALGLGIAGAASLRFGGAR